MIQNVKNGLLRSKRKLTTSTKEGFGRNSPGTNLMEGNLWEHVGYSKRSKNKIYQPDSKEELWSKAMSRFLELTSQTPLHLLPRILLCEPFLLSHYTMDTTNLKNAGFVKSSMWKQHSLKQIWMKISTLNGLRELKNLDMSLNKNCRPRASYWTKLCMVLSKQLCNGSRSLSNVC